MSKRSSFQKRLGDLLIGLITLLVIGAGAWIYENKEKAIRYSYVILFSFLALLIIAAVVWYFFKKKEKIKKEIRLGEEVLWSSFKGMTGSQFEEFVENIYSKLGYKTEITGMAGDGGVDVKAQKDGKTYLIQCKDWNVNKANPDNVSRLHSAVHREKADGGIFVAVGGFTTQARAEFDKIPEIELIDGQGIIDLYKQANAN
jgi:HJR/Mrr/RecB family endonuclease